MKKGVLVYWALAAAAGAGFFAACGSSPSYSSYSAPSYSAPSYSAPSTPAPPPRWAGLTLYGEEEPLLEGTTWGWYSSKYGGVAITYEFRAGGKMTSRWVIDGERGLFTWERKGDVVRIVTVDGYKLYEGKYYPQSQKIMLTERLSNGNSSEYTWEPVSGSARTAPRQSGSSSGGYAESSAPARSSAPRQPAARIYTVTVYWLDNGNKTGQTLVFTATSPGEAEKMAERQWKQFNGYNQNLIFLEAVAN